MALTLALLVLSLAEPQDTAVGGRARGMGGGYTAFEDDPLSVWLNPAGIATQPRGVSLAYQTFTSYEESGTPGPAHRTPSRIGMGEPGGVPSQFGVVYPIGTEERPQALGLCVVSPLLLKLAFDGPDDALSPNVWKSEQSFSRVRLAYARDFRFRSVGEEGWLPHLAVGLGADVAFTTFDSEDLAIGSTSGGSKTEYGGGFGMLLGVFDNTRNLKVNLGLAYQTAITFDLVNLETQNSIPGPTFNWPDQFQLGILFFLMEGLPLRITTELQLVGWRGASQKSEIPGVSNFTKTTSVSAGAEYRLPVGESTALLPRLGVRLFDAPWGSNGARLPATSEWQLFIGTREGRFLLFSAGVGLSFASAGGAVTSFDVAFEYGGDSPGASVGIVVGF